MTLAPADVVVQVLGSALGAHPGAEAAGVICEAGSAAAEWLGRQVVVPRLLPCGECGLCLRGRVSACPALRRRGAPAARETVPARFLLPLGPPLLPQPVPAEEVWRYAALPDALAAPYAGLVRAGKSPGELCAVLGGGFRAAAAVLVVRALGCQAVVLAPDAAERALLCGPPWQAMAGLDPCALDPDAGRAALRELAVQAGLPAHGVCLLETSGTDAGRARALGLVEAGGVAVLLDRTGRMGPTEQGAQQPGDQVMPAPLPAGPGLAGMSVLERICNEQGLVIGAGAAHPDLLPELLALVQRSEIDLSALVLPVPPAEIDEVLARRRQHEGDQLHLPVVKFTS